MRITMQTFNEYMQGQWRREIYDSPTALREVVMMNIKEVGIPSCVSMKRIGLDKTGT